MTSPIVEGRHTGEYIISEASGNRSRANITLGINAAAVVAGTVLGAGMAGVSAAKSGGNTGNATMSAITIGSGAKLGIYTIRMLTATTYVVEDPDGNVIGNGSTGVAFSDDIGFTMTVGGTPMVAGDGFDVTVSATSYGPLDLAATTGLQNPVGILYGSQAISATATAQVAHVRDCEVNGACLTYPAGITTPQKAAVHAALAANHVIVIPAAL